MMGKKQAEEKENQFLFLRMGQSWAAGKWIL